MNAKVISKVVATRGCGRRKPGGLYMVSDGLGAPCGKLPLPLTRCPCCGHGIKFCRGWTWIEPKPLFDAVKCERSAGQCGFCPLSQWPDGERAGLLWIGEKFYATPGDFAREADLMGVSRRIQSVPRGFEIGKTWVLLAHIRGIVNATFGETATTTPAIFRAFKPSAIEYVVTGDETEEKLEQLAARGFTLVRDIEPQTQALPLGSQP